jgi:hypothetical protein
MPKCAFYAKSYILRQMVFFTPSDTKYAKWYCMRDTSLHTLDTRLTGLYSVMAHNSTPESDDQKVFRIARELDINLEDAALTCAGFELAFSDDRMRGAIFNIIDQLDYEAYKKGEPLGMILSYAVELGIEGIQVSRYADEIPRGKVVSLTPTNRAMIFLKIKDNFPTQQFLGPLIVNRPEFQIEKQSSEPGIPTELPSEWSDDIICEPPRPAICLGPIRLTFMERFPFLSAAGSSSHLTGSTSRLDSSGSPIPCYPLPVTCHLSTALHPGRSISGLSPPRRSENLEHSETKDVPTLLANA